MKVNKFGNSSSRKRQAPRDDNNFLSRVRPNLDFDAKGKRLVNLAAPTEEADALTLGYFKTELGFTKDAESNLSVGGKRITALGQPVNDSDAASKQYVDTLAVSKDWEGNLALEGKKIVDLGQPTEEDHAANKRYVDRQVNRVRAQSRVLRRIYSFRSNLEVRDSFKWLAENNQQFCRVTQNGRIVKAILLSARSANKLQVKLTIGPTKSTSISKLTGETATVVNLVSPIEFQTGDEISVINDKIIPGGHHFLEVFCEIDD